MIPVLSTQTTKERLTPPLMRITGRVLAEGVLVEALKSYDNPERSIMRRRIWVPAVSWVVDKQYNPKPLKLF